jgi:hypothetical protein
VNKLSVSKSTSANTASASTAITAMSIIATPVAKQGKTLKVASKNQRFIPKKQLGRLSIQSKDISKKAVTQALHPNLGSKTAYACPICRDRFFVKAQALGGHMSKSHPHQSAEFTKKQETRKERTLVRELLKRAKAVYRETYPTHSQI